MADSVGAAAARGLESGFGMGMRLVENEQRQQAAGLERAERARREQRDEERFAAGERRAAAADARAAAADARTVRMDERQMRMDALRLLDDDVKSLATEGAALWAQYGGYDKVPQDVRDNYVTRYNDLTGRRAAARREFNLPQVEERRRAARETWSRIQAGQLSLDDVSDDDLVSTLTVVTGRPLSDFISLDGKPSRVQQAMADLTAGLQTGNGDLTVKGAGVLLAPELAVGVGTPGRDGHEIVAKELYNLVPHPQQPGLIVPLIKVTTRRPDGATGSYVAPATEGRSADPAANVITFSIDDALNRAQALDTLAGALSAPQLRGRVEKGLAGAGGKAADEFRGALAGLGISPPAKQVQRERVDLGDRVLERTLNPDGSIASETSMPKGAPPRRGRSGGGLGDDAAPASRTEGLSGEALLKALDPETARVVKGLAEGKIKPESISLKGNRREHMLALATQYDPDSGPAAKPLPEPVRKAITEVRDNAATMKRALGSFKDEFASKGVLGLGADKQLSASAILGVDKDAVDWWKNYRKNTELVERHAMFGAALTAHEQNAWRSADINPGMDAAVIRKNLQTREALARRVLDATRQDMIDAGHGDKRINAIATRDMSLDNAPPDTDQRRSGGVSDAADDLNTLPPEAIAKLKPGKIITFPNKTEWILRDGQPVRVK